ncbi:MAG: PorV/PorQ family protein [bacterium]|nr:PorV/PorQ family protein [bacterium]
MKLQVTSHKSQVKTLLTIILIYFFITVYQVFAGSQDAGDAAAFLKSGQSVRALGMGKAFTAIADDASASYWNPAGLAQLNKNEFMFMYSKPFSLVSGIQNENIAFALPFSFDYNYENLKAAVGFNIIYSAVDGIKGYTEQALPTGEEFSNRDMAYLLSCGVNGLIQNTDLGITFKIISQKIYTYSDYGFGADIGSLYHWQNFRFGLVLQDVLQAKIKLKDTSDIIPVKLKTGIAYSIPDIFTVSMGLDLIRNRDLKEHFGIEYTIAKLVSLRGGYTTDTNEITAGLGFKKEAYEINYAFARHEELENSHRVSLSIRF